MIFKASKPPLTVQNHYRESYSDATPKPGSLPEMKSLPPVIDEYNCRGQGVPCGVSVCGSPGFACPLSIRERIYGMVSS